MSNHLTFVIPGMDPAPVARDLGATGSRPDDMRRRLRRQRSIAELKALCLTAPAFVFLLLTFIGPLLFFMNRAVDNSDVVDNLPRTTRAIAAWKATDTLPPDAVQQALIDDLSAMRGTPALAVLARNLNYSQSGYRSLLQKTANGLASQAGATAGARLTSLDPVWGEPLIWQTLRQESSRWTPLFLLSALDLKRAPDGSIGTVDPTNAIYQRVFMRTFFASVVVTSICALLGYVTAFGLVRLGAGLGRAALFIVLISLWTSLLVRTLAWIIILQKNGVLNAALMGTGIIEEPLQFVRTWFAVGLAMVHLLLPMMILPIASVMRSIPPSYVRAARSLGASPWRAFWSVYLPLTFPGIGAGIILVATLALGFFITPELLGGPEHQMVSYFVAFFTNMSVNWGLASALGTWLFLMTVAFLAVVYRVFGITRVTI